MPPDTPLPRARHWLWRLLMAVALIAALAPVAVPCGSPYVTCMPAPDAEGYVDVYYEVEPLAVLLLETVTRAYMPLAYFSGHRREQIPMPPTPTFTPSPAATAAPTATPAPSATPAATPASASKWRFWVNGTQLRGANIYQRRVFPELDGETFLGAGPLGPPYTQDDFDRLAASGANWVNLSVPGLFTVTPPYRPDPDVVATVDALINMAAQAHLYVVLSARTGPGRSEFSILRDGAGEWFDEKYLIETVWEDAEARAAWAEMWRYTAQRYRDNPVVVGYDLMVEPNANHIVGVWQPQAFERQYRGSGYDWNSWYPSLVDAIRSVDPDTPILVGCMGYSAVNWLETMQPVDAPHIVYTVHQYAPFAYTHQEIGDGVAFPDMLDVDGDGDVEAFDADWLADYLHAIAVFRERSGAPVAVNEVGIKRWAPQANAFMATQLDMLEDLGVNYAVWMWYASWPPLAEGDHDFNFRFGPLPENRADTPNALWQTYRSFWARNTVRP